MLSFTLFADSITCAANTAGSQTTTTVTDTVNAQTQALEDACTQYLDGTLTAEQAITNGGTDLTTALEGIDITALSTATSSIFTAATGLSDGALSFTDVTAVTTALNDVNSALGTDVSVTSITSVTTTMTELLACTPEELSDLTVSISDATGGLVDGITDISGITDTVNDIAGGSTSFDDLWDQLSDLTDQLNDLAGVTV